MFINSLPMKRLIIISLAVLLSFAAFPQPKEIKVSVDGIDIELVRIDPGTVTIPARTGYTQGRDPQTGKWVLLYKDPMTGSYVSVSESIKIPESTENISETFYIMKYPVTRAQWGRIQTGSEKYMQTGKKATMPITMSYSTDDGVDNNLDLHALPFLRILKKKTGLEWQLPSLGEWLLACGPLPDNIEDYAWIDGGVHQVGLKKPNANGIYDMLGGISEMVARTMYVKDGKLVTEHPRYVGGIPLIGGKSYRNDPSKLLELRNGAPISSMWPPTLRFVLKYIPQDCPGTLKMQIVKEGDKYGLETEYGMVLKPEYSVVKITKVDPELSEGGGFLASKDGKWGVFNRKGEALLPMIFDDEKTATDNISLLEYVSYSYCYKQEVNRLASQKGEFEKTSDFEARKADPALQKAYLEPLMKDFEQKFIALVTQNERSAIMLLDYDADREVYRFKVNNARTAWTVYELNVPVESAPAFKEYMSTVPMKELIQSAEWGIVNDSIQILRITFTLPDGNSFTYANPACVSSL